MPLGQLSHLPPDLASNPFHPFLTRFARFKTGSFEVLFAVEAFLLRYSWFALLVLFALVLPPLEEVDLLSTLILFLTLVYPCFFIWSLTRLSGVELMQCVLEGHWTAELLATPIDNRDLTLGFLTPIWLIVRQYGLISVFSLFLYTLETQPVIIDGELYAADMAPPMILSYGLFFSAAAWIVFIYVARMFAEVRLRSGLLKGLWTLMLLLGGLALFALYAAMLLLFPAETQSAPFLTFLMLLTAALAALSTWFYRKLVRLFREYLAGQLDIDLVIFDDIDPRATGWTTEG
ncbi:MAG TPA: hypothetical protein PLG73_04315 [Candidatus Sumerlaeota bacterium]|nr:hypothetical protein [Candidatus Sumerlaeota bacterium]